MQQQKTGNTAGQDPKDPGAAWPGGRVLQPSNDNNKPRQTNKHFNKFKKYQARQWELQGKQAKGVPKESVASNATGSRGGEVRNCTALSAVLYNCEVA